MMTKDEIKKALECCCGYEASCDNCPNAKDKGYGCKDKLLANVHNLITEQEKEIEQLKAAKNDWKQRYESVDKQYMTFIASSTECINKKVKQAKIDVLTELKERYGIHNTFFTDCVPIDDIDEMIEELKKNDTL